MNHAVANTPGLPLRTFLIRLIWLCVLPLLLLASWLAYDSLSEREARQRREADRLARNLATTIDQRLEVHAGALNILATSPLLDDRDRWHELYREAQGYQQIFGSHVILAEADERMQMLFNTRLPFGSPLPLLPRPQGRAAAPLAIATGKPAVGDMFVGPVAGKSMVAIAVPALRNGKVASIIVTTFETAQFQERIDQHSIPTGWAVSLRDGRGDTIASRVPAGFDPGHDADAGSRFTAPTARAPWSVVVDIPQSVRHAPFYTTIATLALLLLAATLAGILGGIAASRRLVRAVDALSGTPAEATKPTNIAEIDAARRRIDAATAELVESEANFHAIFNGILDAVVYADTSRRIRLVNPAFTRLFGYSAEEVVGRSTEFLYADPDDYAAMGRLRFSTGAGASTEHYEMRYRRKDGSEFWAESGGNRVCTQDGTVLGFMGTHRDITTRRSSEEQLRLWAESFERSQLGLAITDAQDNTFVAVNPAFALARGYTVEELVGQPIAVIYPEEALPELHRQVAAAEAESHGTFESEHRTRDGRRFPVLLDVTVLQDAAGRPSKRVIFVFDISERKRAEEALAVALAQQKQARIATLNQMQDANAARESAEAALTALRESREQLKLFIDHAPASLAMFDRDMRYLAVSRRWLDDYGLGDRSLAGCSHYDVFPEISEEWKAIHRRALAGEVIRADSDRFERADGSVQWLRWEVRPWYDASEAIGGIVVFSEDITRQILAEEEIRNLNADLERRVIERTAELAAANRELDSFAYAVSHDLRAPLRAMSGFSRALEEDFANQLSGEAKAYLDQIVIASTRMSELVDGLLALSRSTRGELRREAIDLSAMAGECLAALAREEPQRQMNWQIEPGLTVTGEPRMMEAVLENLLSNAWKYTGKTAAPYIRVYGEESEGEHWICVEDNGAGFSQAHADRLFKPFQRLHRQDEFPGIGIGLATAQRIIHRHGGRIRATGEPGHGAKFCFSLPAHTRTERSEEA